MYYLKNFGEKIFFEWSIHKSRLQHDTDPPASFEIGLYPGAFCSVGHLRFAMGDLSPLLTLGVEGLSFLTV